jgi:hypothetical protein
MIDVRLTTKNIVENIENQLTEIQSGQMVGKHGRILPRWA